MFNVILLFFMEDMILLETLWYDIYVDFLIDFLIGSFVVEHSLVVLQGWPIELFLIPASVPQLV